MKRKLGIFAMALAMLTAFIACKSVEGGGPSESENSDVPLSTPDAAESTTTSNTPLTYEVTTTESHDDPINTENGIVQTAEALIGIPFAENGTTPSEGFDNSGFIYYVLRENGFINCPRRTQEQAAMGTNIDYDHLKSGDLAFFSSDGSGSLDFGGIYIGEGQMIYSPMPGQTVKVADITSDYWKNSFVTGVSLS